MPILTLCAKAYRDRQLRQIEPLLRAKLEGLKVNFKVRDATSRGWVRVELSGEDERVATNFLANEVGLCSTNLEGLRKFSTAKACITTFGKSRDSSLSLDVGVYEPEVVDATLPLSSLQAQLCDGRKVALNRISQLYGFCDDYPLTAKIVSLDADQKRIEAVLAETQLGQFRGWTDSLLDRLVVLGSPEDEVTVAVEKTGFARDVVKIEPLGLLEHAIVCKLGTDAAGLIPRLGRCLPNTVFSVFSPRRLLEFFGEDSNLPALS
jgi:hypothetical protein